MPNGTPMSDDERKLMDALSKEGIVDLDGLVRRIAQQKKDPMEPQTFLCTHNYCVVVREK